MDDESAVDSSCNLNLETSLILMNFVVSFFFLLWLFLTMENELCQLEPAVYLKKKFFLKGTQNMEKKKSTP